MHTSNHNLITSDLFKSFMASEDHTHEGRETTDNFSLDPNTSDTPLFRFYGRGLPSGVPDEVRRSSPFRTCGWNYLTSSP